MQRHRKKLAKSVQTLVGCYYPYEILDEFNSPGPNRENILFAEFIARYGYGNKITLIFVTQK